MKLISILSLSLLLFLPVLAEANMDPALQGKNAEKLIEKLSTDAIQSLKKTAGDEKARRAEFKRILNKNFDMVTIARFAMGRYWAVATDSERKQYTKLFRNMIIGVYSQRFADYSDQVIEIVGSKPAGRKDHLVNSLIRGGGQPIKLDWRVRKNKVIDVIVEGVSMSVTQRSEFASIIQRGGGEVASLITYLQK